MLFLYGHGVSTSKAVRIYKTYGNQAIGKVKNNPYVLAKDIYGIGFKTADQIAQNVGIPRDSLARASAGIDHVLLEATTEGHCGLPVAQLIASAVKLLAVGEGTVEQALSQMITCGSLLLEMIRGESLVFLPHLRKAEEGIAAKIRALVQTQPAYPPIDFEKAVRWCEAKTGKTLAPSQRDALQTALTCRVVIITGGPGVGKTTLVNSILTILRAKGVKCLLCAPTGRAAKRLSETTGMEAKTIHRLLEVQPGTGRYARNESNPLNGDLVVMDEASMVDVVLMHSVLKAVPVRAALILVGDVDQLPSVGPGNVLKDLIDCGLVPVVRLTEVFRQAAGSQIIVTAHRIRRGLMPEAVQGTASDFHFVARDEPERIAATLEDLVQHRIPGRFQLDPIRDVQILCPMNRGSLGVRELNQRLQRLLNPPKPAEPAVEKYGWRFQIRDKVMQTELATPPSPPACARVPNPHNSGCGSALRAGASVFAGPHTGRQPSARSLPWTPPNVRPAPPVDTCSASPDRPLPLPVPGSRSAPGCSAPGAPLLPSPAPSRGAPGRRVASRSPPAGTAPVGSPRRETNGPPRCATRHPQYPPAAQNRLLPTGRPWRKMPATLGRFPWKRSWPADGWPPWPPRSVVGKAPRARS